jgi:hypothetical protein
MNKPGIEELLIACVLDPQLLNRLRESPDSVFADYELSDQVRELLVSPNQRLLELLGKVVHQQAGDQQFPVMNEPAQMPANETAVRPPPFSLPESRLALRLVPYLQRAAATESATDGHLQLSVNYVGHLDSLPPGRSLEELPGVPPADVRGQTLPPLSLIVAVQAQVWTDEAGSQQITFSISARLPQDSAASQPSDSVDESAAQDLTPWRHDVNSSAIKAAAARVHGAQKEDRRQRLLELIDVMVAPPTLAESGS